MSSRLKMVSKIFALIRLKDGSGHISCYRLRYGLKFTKTEMRKWIKESSIKPIKSITFLPGIRSS